MSYSVQSTNIFDLLSEDNAENLGTTEKVKPSSKTGPTQQTKSGNVPPTKTQQSTKPPKTEQRKSVNDTNKGFSDTRGPKSTFERKDRGEGQDFSTSGERKPSTFQPRQPREPREPRGGFSERPDNEKKDKDAGFSSGNKRVYDRRSGTGRGKENKKQGSGKGNWGREVEGFEEPQISGEESKPVSEPEKEKEEVKHQEPEKDPETLEREKKEQEEHEKEAKMMLYDEYVQQQQSKAVNVALPEARKPNEGADRSEAKKWASYTQLKRDDEDGEEESSEASGKQKEKKSNKKVVPVDQVFIVQQKRRERPERPEWERSERSDRPDRQDRRKTSKPFGRGGGRGRGFNTTSTSTSQSSSQSEPNFDESSFPSLATKA